MFPVAEPLTAPMAAQRRHLDPYSANAVVVLPVATSIPVVLFPEERAAIRRRVARRLAKLGYEVVPIGDLERIEASAADRRLVLEGDAICRAPLSREDVHARYFTNSRTASVDAGCFDDDCELSVTVEDPRDPDAVVSYSAGVAHGAQPVAWKRAAARFDVTDTGAWGGIGGMVSSSHPPPIMFTAPDHIGPWVEPPDAEAFFALEQKTNGCGHPDPNVAMTWTVGLAVDADGGVGRCEAETEHSRAGASGPDCLCEAATTLHFPAGKPGRRVRVEAIDSGSHARTVVRTVQLETESWVTRLQESGATEKCEPELRRTEPLEVTAVLELTPDGSVEKVELFGGIDDAPTMQWARCLVHEWSSLELPCAPPGIEQLQATVEFRAL